MIEILIKLWMSSVFLGLAMGINLVLFFMLEDFWALKLFH